MKKFLWALFVLLGAFLGLVLLISVMVAINPEWSTSTNGLLVIQAIQTIVLFGCTTYVGVKFTETGNPLKLMSLTKGLTIKQIVISFLFAISALPIISFFSEWNKGMELPSFLASMEEIMKQMEDQAMVMTERFLSTSSVGMLFVNLFVIALLPALCEEMMFRGWLQRRVSNSVNIHVAIWVSAFVFSAIHFQFYGFLPRMLIGAALGYLYYYTGSLWAPIIAHFTNNAVAVATTFLTYNKITTTDFDMIGVGDMWYMSLASVAVCVALMCVLRREQLERLKQ